MVGNQESNGVRAKRVLVPVANPETARCLIDMAQRLSDPDAGQVLALLVTVAGQELNSDLLEAMHAIVEDAQVAGQQVELITSTAPSVARGILDAALEHGATLIVLGFQSAAGGRTTVGPIVESVARTAPCDLVVFRQPSKQRLNPNDIEQVILPLDGSDNSKVAARLGTALAAEYDAAVTAVYVHTDASRPEWFGLARIEASLSVLQDSSKIRRQVIRAQDIVRGILTRCDARTLVVLGYSERSALDHWIFGDVTQRMLAEAPGPVILAKRATAGEGTVVQRLGRRWLARFAPILTPSEKTDVVRQAAEISQPDLNFVVLMVLSVLLASFGLLQNSAAVIIGAMLVAPLMSPLMAFSVGLTQGNLALMRSASRTVLIGVAIGLGVAVAGGLVMPLEVLTSEMRARAHPSLLDMGVALASGAAGAYAMARRDVPSALVGVAIAAALVPPLSTVGLALAFGEWSLASGAMLLFLTNIVSISLAGAVVFAWLGLRPGREAHTRFQVIASLMVLALLAVPLAGTFVEVIRTGQNAQAARSVLEEQFVGSEVLDVNLHDRNLTATVRGPQLVTLSQVERAEAAVEERLGRDITLEITYWRAIKPLP